MYRILFFSVARNTRRLREHVVKSRAVHTAEGYMPCALCFCLCQIESSITSRTSPAAAAAAARGDAGGATKIGQHQKHN